MKQLALAIIVFGLLVQPAAGQGFYDPTNIHTIQLIFSQSNWDAILDSLFARELDERLLGTAIIDGVQYDSVGVRYKGNSTYRANQVKNPFNIKLDYIIDNQEIEGYGTLKLANVWSDPSFVREVLGYEIARKYMPACQANYTNVYVNGTLIGFYVSVQDIDKLFLRTHFGNDENPCFKGSYDGMSSSYAVWGYRGTDTSLYTMLYEIDSDEGWPELIDFLDTLNNYSSAVAEVLDIDRHLWMLAYDFLLVNLDAPVNMNHNYYLYRNDDHRFNPIIWDLNMNFGGFTQLIGGSSLTLTGMQQLNPLTNASSSNYPIINKILNNATWKRMYFAHMKTMMEENFSNGSYQTRGAELQSLIASYVQAVPNKFYTYTAFQTNLTASAGGGQTVCGIVPLMAGRVSYLNTRSEFTAQAPSIVAVAHTPTTVQIGTTARFTAHVRFASSVQLGYKVSSSEGFVKAAMLDDGNHGDGVAGDSVYGVTITAGSSDIHYYIYAENSSAGAFLPARAEWEDSVVTVTSPTVNEVVINEFMADNGTTQADQDGEFDDWVELYNPSAASISLKGCHLSDKLTNLTKWTFPDTSIAAGGYLVIWADEDTTQVGLHAKFALSKSGEAVVLSDSLAVIIDSVTFTSQVTDSTTGRLPNGTGSFVRMAPTFGYSNNTADCVGTVGNVDCSVDDGVDIGDLTALINNLFITFDPLCSPGEANCDGDSENSIDIGDLTALINNLFITFEVLPACQ